MQEDKNNWSLLNFYFKKFINPFSLIIFFQFVFYILLILNREVWVDEAYSLTTSSFRLSDIFFISLNFEGNPPLYFLLLGIWRTIDSSIFFARILSIALTIIGTGVFYKILRFFMKKKHALILTVLIVFNPYIIFIALNVRYYAFAFLLGNLIILFFLKYFVYGEAKFHQVVIFSLVSILAIGTQYQMVFLLFALGVSLPALKKWKIFFRYIMGMIAPGLIFLVMMGYLLQVMDTLSGYSDLHFGVLSIYPALVSWVEDYLGFFHWRWGYHPLFYWLFRLPILVLLVNFLFGSPLKTIKTNKIFKVTIISLGIIIFIFLLFLFLLIQERFLLAWHRMVLLPLMMMLLGLFFEYGRYRVVSYSAIIALVLIQLVSIHNYFKIDFLSQGFQEVSQYLKTKNLPHKSIFVFPAETALVAKYELPSSEIISVPVEIDFFDVFDHNLWVLDSQEQLEELFLPVMKRTDTVNLLRKKNIIPFYNVSYNTHILDSFLQESRWKILADTSFSELRYISFTHKEE